MPIRAVMVVLALSSSLLAGCAVGPDYERPGGWDGVVETSTALIIDRQDGPRLSIDPRAHEQVP